MYNNKKYKKNKNEDIYDDLINILNQYYQDLLLFEKHKRNCEYEENCNHYYPKIEDYMEIVLQYPEKKFYYALNSLNLKPDLKNDMISYFNYKKLKTNTINSNSVKYLKYMITDYVDYEGNDRNLINEIIEIKNILKNYIATPWGYTIDTLDDYYQLLDEYNNNLCKIDPKSEECLDKNSNKICSKESGKNLCSSHGGDLLEHSQWTALYILLWFKDKNIITEGLDELTCVLSAFFHDIGKASDCVYDMYSNEKYEGKGEQVHPEHSGDIIMGTRELKNCEKNISINLIKLISNFPNVNIVDIALSAYMHWEFGRINIPLDKHIVFYTEEEKLEYKYSRYFSTFMDYVNKLNISPIKSNLLYLLKLCIIVSCADIAAGSNVRLKLDFSNIVRPQKYPSNDPWVRFNMQNNYISYREGLIKYFEKHLK